MLEPEHDHGDVNPVAATAAKESDGEVRRMTLDDDDRLRTVAALAMDEVGRTLKEVLTGVLNALQQIDAKMDTIIAYLENMSEAKLTNVDL